MAEKLTPTELIGQLLTKADSSTHEAEKLLCFERAQELASRHSIDLAVARAASERSLKRETPTQTHVTIGKRAQRALAWYVELYCVIARNNDLKITISPSSVSVTLYGFPSDIEVAQAIYMHAITAMIQLGDAYLKKGDYKKDVRSLRVKIRTPNPEYGGHNYWGADPPKYNYHWTYVEKSVSGMTARQNFYRGFVQKIGDRLEEAKRAAEAVELTHEQAASMPKPNFGVISTALVLADKKREVDEYYTGRIGGRRLGSWSGSKSPVYSSGAAAAGRDAAAGVALGGRSNSLPGARRQLGS